MIVALVFAALLVGVPWTRGGRDDGQDGGERDKIALTMADTFPFMISCMVS